MMEKVERALKHEFVNVVNKTRRQDTYSMVASIFNSLDRSLEMRYMEMLEERSPESAFKIRNLMFTFNDLVRIDKQGIITLLANIDVSILPVALKDATDELKELFFSSMSTRQSNIIREEIESIKVRAKQVYESQTKIVSKAKELLASAEIEIAEDENDEYL